MELKRSLRILDETRRKLPYNFELALILAEVQLVTELMILASRFVLSHIFQSFLALEIAYFQFLKNSEAGLEHFYYVEKDINFK